MGNHNCHNNNDINDINDINININNNVNDLNKQDNEYSDQEVREYLIQLVDGLKQPDYKDLNGYYPLKNFDGYHPLKHNEYFEKQNNNPLKQHGVLSGELFNRPIEFDVEKIHKEIYNECVVDYKFKND